MTINFNVSDRKPLVKAVSEFLGTKAVYMKTPTCAYRIGNVTVTREGNLRIDDPIDSEQVEKLIAVVAGQGFTAERSDKCPPHSADRDSQPITVSHTPPTQPPQGFVFRCPAVCSPIPRSPT